MEKVSLETAASYILEECRMVLPGIQALFGFQLIAVFSEGFAQYLSSAQQNLHLAAIVLVAFAIALVMAPAAVHRQAQPQQLSERFIRVASNLLLASILPLALGLCIELYLVGMVILEHEAAALAIAAVLAALFVFLWVLLPRRYRR